jgi:Protein of unknown function (DUF2793)
MEETDNLSLPYLMAAQSQKHVTHNESLRALDVVVQLAVEDRDLSTPPASPAAGARYLIAAPGTADWSGHEGEITAFQDGAWMFHTPQEGWIVWVSDEDAALVFNGAAWMALSSGGSGSVNPTPLVGVNTTADTTNRLSVSSPASLFNHEGNGHQQKINKAAAGDTASVLFQTGFSGRAEMGTTGDDDYHFKVSPDGSSWKEAITIDKDTGEVTFPNTTLSGGREVLTANRTYYVRTDGNDSNDGLANSSGGAFATLQKAVDTAAGLDLAIYDVTIDAQSGTYSEAVVLKTLVGAGKVIIDGDTTTPSNCIIDGDSSTGVVGGTYAGYYVLKGFRLTTSVSAGYGTYVAGGGGFLELSDIEYADASIANKLTAHSGGCCYVSGDIEISAGGNRAFFASGPGAKIQVIAANTITMTGTPNFSAFTAQAEELAEIRFVTGATTFSGAATGTRYSAESLGLVQTNGAGATYYPGSASGSTSNGGVYV